MRDLGLAGFLGSLLILGLRRPFIFILGYIYIDIVSPQRLAYGPLGDVPVSLLMFALAILGWVITDRKDDVRIAPRQILMALLLVYCGLTAYYIAEFQVEAFEKWDWVWKAMVFAIFLPLTLRTKLRIETVLLFMTLSLAAIVIGAGIKTVAGGSGYGSFAMMVDNNSGLYEDSTLSTVAIMMIPVILYFTKYGTVFRPDWKVSLFCYALVFACLLTPIGTQARTGLVCIAVLAMLILRDTKRRGLFIAGAALGGLIALPLLPTAFAERMGTIRTFQADESASTRVAVWLWTLDYVQENPLGGGFDAYRGNSFAYYTTEATESGGATTVHRRFMTDRARAYHSAYFEMLGEQGWIGLGLWLLIQGIGVLRMEWLRRRYRGERAPPGYEWVSPLATALQHAQIIYLVGALFVGIAYQPFVLMLLSVQIGLDTYLARIRKRDGFKPLSETLGESGTPRLSPAMRAET
ncbi:putative O-glycosylation ligase, exosortase A system-associated [Parasphingopyxis algicola]|uniref:putative O-glycosylation ligase, exosortase A system-associated n=1 Tax=Parasphingopyxis algicola TaxID=2026624 RepID=UPI00159FF770|nr:putative O-glycosylation ligase, exosortase A system-associated [Parasphingopyxis algicola]QLC26697.1 putative O-glycosylation ligase, exosortase A system-associated [Parasphingopyxis algicola]